MPELREHQQCGYCGSDVTSWPRHQVMTFCTCCEQPIMPVGRSLHWATDKPNIPVLHLAEWIMIAVAAAAAVIYLLGAENAAYHIAAYALVGGAATRGWEAFANFRTRTSQVWGRVQRGGADSLIAPVLLLLMASWFLVVTMS